MEKMELKNKAMNILSRELSEEEFARVTSIAVGDSDAMKEISLSIKAEEVKQKTLHMEATILAEQKRLNSRELDKSVLELANERAGDILGALSVYLKVKALANNPTSLSIAMWYDEHGRITPKQKEVLLKYSVVT